MMHASIVVTRRGEPYAMLKDVSPRIGPAWKWMRGKPEAEWNGNDWVAVWHHWKWGNEDLVVYEIASDKIKREEKIWPEVVKYFDRDPSEWKCAATVALVFFVGSIALAPALTRDQKKLAAEINTKTLKAAAAIKTSTRLPLRVQNSQENAQRRGAEDTRPKFSRFAKLRFS